MRENGGSDGRENRVHRVKEAKIISRKAGDGEGGG